MLDPQGPEATPRAARRERQRPVALLFTAQLVGFGTRKTGMVFWAETLAKLGWDTHAVTVQLSMLSRLAGSTRLDPVPAAERNAWLRRGVNLSSYVWIPLLHPARLGGVLDAIAGRLLCSVYPRLLPQSIREVAARADLIVIESCSAVALFPFLKRLAPAARFVYCASDRLDVVGMQPALSDILRETAPHYDLVRVPARSMIADFSPPTRAQFIPHGIDKAAFDSALPRPYPAGSKNAVVAGEMMFDREVVLSLAERFPEVTFHAFGRMPLADVTHLANLRFHGEVPFRSLVPYLIHADVGLAPYLYQPRLDYLAESSLKLLQYTYCRLPIVAPQFASSGQPHVIGYAAGDAASAAQAMERELRFDRATIGSNAAADWSEMMRAVLAAAGLAAINSANEQAVEQISERASGASVIR